MGDRKRRQGRREFDQHALKMLHEANLPTTPLPKERGLTTCFLHTHNSQCLVVAVGESEGEGADRALASGLGLARGRELVLVVPQDHARATLHRAAWLRAPLRVFTHDNASLTPVPIPSRESVRMAYDDKLVTGLHQLGDREAWVLALRSLLEIPNVVYAPRRSYQCWLYHGRAVLKIKRTHRGLRIMAGVNYSRPRPGQRKAESLEIYGPLEADRLQILKDVIHDAILARREGPDRLTSEEHRLQAALAAPSAATLFTPIQHREFPVIRWKGGRRLRGYIDLLRLDPTNGIRIMETKVGQDIMLVLQGLDYYIWAKAHGDELTKRLGVKDSTPIQIDYLIGRKGGAKLVHPYIKEHVSALAKDVRVEFHQVTDWHGSLQVTPLLLGASTERRSAPPM